MRSLLFIGGPADGTHIELAENEETLSIPEKVPLHRAIHAIREHTVKMYAYKRQTLFTGGPAFDFMICSELTFAEAIEKLIAGYHPEVGSQGEHQANLPPRRG